MGIYPIIVSYKKSWSKTSAVGACLSADLAQHGSLWLSEAQRGSTYLPAAVPGFSKPSQKVLHRYCWEWLPSIYRGLTCIENRRVLSTLPCSSHQKAKRPNTKNCPVWMENLLQVQIISFKTSWFWFCFYIFIACSMSVLSGATGISGLCITLQVKARWDCIDISHLRTCLW